MKKQCAFTIFIIGHLHQTVYILAIKPIKCSKLKKSECTFFFNFKSLRIQSAFTDFLFGHWDQYLGHFTKEQFLWDASYIHTYIKNGLPYSPLLIHLYQYRVCQRGCSLTHSARTLPAVHPGFTIWLKLRKKGKQMFMSIFWFLDKIEFETFFLALGFFLEGGGQFFSSCFDEIEKKRTTIWPGMIFFRGGAILYEI